MALVDRAFFIRGDDGGEYGPVELEELREWVRENRAGLGTEVRLDEPGALWQPWQYYPELVALLAEVETQADGPLAGPPGLVLAPMGKRALACLADLILGYFLAFPIVYTTMMLTVPDWEEQFMTAFLQPQNPLPQPLLHDVLIVNLIAYGMLTLYLAGFHAGHGRTPAKSMMHIRVVDQNGQKPRLAKSFLRALTMVVSLYFYGIPFAYAFFNPQRRTLHDFIAGTYVVEA